MKAAIWVLALASLAGCAAPSMNELRQEEPRQVLHSKKAVKVIADCVQHGWENLSVFEGRSGATQEPGKKGAITVATTGSAYFVDIQPDASGSVAKYYASTYRWISRKHLDTVENCL